jgi:hypothetical protein
LNTDVISIRGNSVPQGLCILLWGIRSDGQVINAYRILIYRAKWFPMTSNPYYIYDLSNRFFIILPDELSLIEDSSGHDVRSLDTKFGRQHIIEGIRWASGDN